MKHNSITLMLVGILALPGATLAQGHHPQAEEGKPRSGMMGMGQGHAMMGMISPSPALILGQKEALNLTESQVERLEALQKELTQAREAHMSQIQPLYMEAMKAAEGDKLDLSRYESTLKKLAEHHVKMQVEMARFGQRGIEVLNPEQGSNVRYGMHFMRAMMGSGMMQGASMMGGEGCPMMRGMGGSD